MSSNIFCSNLSNPAVQLLESLGQWQSSETYFTLSLCKVSPLAKLFPGGNRQPLISLGEHSRPSQDRGMGRLEPLSSASIQERHGPRLPLTSASGGGGKGGSELDQWRLVCVPAPLQCCGKVSSQGSWMSREIAYFLKVVTGNWRTSMVMAGPEIEPSGREPLVTWWLPLTFRPLVLSSFMAV